MAWGEEGQTLGLYIVAVAALFFLAFAFFAVGQAGSVRNSAQTAADAAALGAAGEARDEAHDAFLEALVKGDLPKLTQLLSGQGMPGVGACGAASDLADANRADRQICARVDGPPGYTVSVLTRGTVGDSVVKGTSNMHATASATAVVEGRCVVAGVEGKAVKFSCNKGEELTIDATATDFRLNLAQFYTVHLST
ncbi:pilus assembly protein TadG-related protein [Streptomyces sp. RKAG337]|uniref:pilus assembly protein TadG-related protein n=1 Tax=Streptomyces sp. RKAG337 TaxID=2893404 RepID=UPI002554CFE1|nr:pilus assembly protein TadG-related protein [Streptomyces sp. RKAG337]